MRELTIEINIGAILRDMRLSKMRTQKGKAKLTQKKLADIIGMSRETVCCIENGHKTQVEFLRLDVMNKWILACDTVGISKLKKELGACVISKINGGELC